MAIRTYGKSVASYTAWQASTPYLAGASRVPTVDNGMRYEATQAGTSDLTQPEWPDVPEQNVQDGTVVWTCREKEEAPGPLSVELDLKDAGGYSLKDIWVKSSAAGDFIIYGSYNGEDWRQIDEMALPQPSGRDNRHKGLQNAYPYIRVSTDLAAVNEIEIVASKV